MSPSVLLRALVMACAMTTHAHATPPATVPVADYTLQVGYLDHAAEGLYEIQYNTPGNLVMTAVIDRAQADQDLGYVYAFDADTLEKRWRLAMQHQAFALAQDRTHNKLFVSHGKNRALSISRVDIATGTLEQTSARLPIQPEDFKGNESLRHMVYVPQVNRLFVSYSATGESSTESGRYHKLLVIDPDTLELVGQVEGAYPRTGYALTYDDTEQRIYTGGSGYINVIDPATLQVVRSLDMSQAEPQAANLLSLGIDHAHKRIFAAQNIFRSEGEQDGLYVFDLETGKQLAFVRSGRGSINVAYNPERDEAYVANFREGTIRVISGKDYSVVRTFDIGPLPNELAYDAAQRRLYVGLKEVYSPRSSTGDFVEGAKERLLKITLPSEQ